MKRSVFGLLGAALVAGIAMACAFAVSVRDDVVHAFAMVYESASLFVATALNLAHPEQPERTQRIMGVVQAKAFILRMVKRERPVITSSWRMCQST
jgi:hypothetical protein